MVDSITNLAFSMSASKGVYALLLGSGISRSAGILTGWEITLELIRKHAHIIDPDLQLDEQGCIDWYHQHITNGQNIEHGRYPDYSKVVEALAPEQVDRQALLRPYFEPTEIDREQNKKVPTQAHHAIAKLIKSGHVKLVLTTNFDHLLELALADIGIEPDIISTVDDLQGRRPICHSPHCIVKLHGDYQDLRIKNTLTELSVYETEFNDLLDHVLDDYGLVICGWSAEWDIALREAIMRAPNRRYSTYYTSYGKPGTQAQELIQKRKATEIQIDGADEFFTALQEQVQSIEEYSRHHPDLIELAVAMMKHYMADANRRIQLEDFVDQVTTDTIASLKKIWDSPSYGTINELIELFHRIETACSMLTAIAAIGGAFYAKEHEQMWTRVIKQLLVYSDSSISSKRNEIRRCPVRIILYALSIGAVRGGHIQMISMLLNVSCSNYQEREVSVVDIAKRFCADAYTWRDYKPIIHMSEWLYDTLRQPFMQLLHDESMYKQIFDTADILISLGVAYRGKIGGSMQFLVGLYGIRDHHYTLLKRQIEESISIYKNSSEYVSIGFIGYDATECEDTLKEFHEEFIKQCAVLKG